MIAMADERDHERRRLVVATAAVGGLGALLSSIPFIQSLSPSEAARAAGVPVVVDLEGLAQGTILTIEWRCKPVWILHRTAQMLAQLSGHDAQLADPLSRDSEQPDYAANPQRSIQPAYFIAVGLCTHLGCIPSLRAAAGADDLGSAWPGGFYCPRHGSRFDLSGRVFKNVPAPRNLVVPVHRFLSDTRVEIGRDDGRLQ